MWGFVDELNLRACNATIQHASRGSTTPPPPSLAAPSWLQAFLGSASQRVDEPKHYRTSADQGSRRTSWVDRAHAGARGALSELLGFAAALGEAGVRALGRSQWAFDGSEAAQRKTRPLRVWWVCRPRGTLRSGMSRFARPCLGCHRQ